MNTLLIEHFRTCGGFKWREKLAEINRLLPGKFIPILCLFSSEFLKACDPIFDVFGVGIRKDLKNVEEPLHKGLQNFVFDPGERCSVLRSRTMQWKQGMLEFFNLEDADLRTSPFKRGGDDATMISLIFKGLETMEDQWLDRKWIG